jgi:oligopeptide transport system ATP-binding protein
MTRPAGSNETAKSHTWSQEASDSMTTVLEVKDLVTRFSTREGTVHAVNGVSFSLTEGETLGVVGESGCGKSVTMLSVLRLIPIPPAKIERGEALFLGRDLLKMSSSEIRAVRGAQIGMVFQDPMTSLNPVLTIGRQLTEPLEVHQNMSGSDARDRAVELLEMVGIPSAKGRLDDYPHQFSGGMRQRVMIAMALACTPQLLIADEPTTALDVTIQAQILDLVKRLREKMGMSIIWITHDLGIVAGIAHRVMVMYAGFIVERAAAGQLYANPLHPYTHGLLGSLPRVDDTTSRRLVNIEGAPPDMFVAPVGCPFAPRCTYAYDRCRAENPLLMVAETEHEVACWWDIQRGKPRYDR